MEERKQLNLNKDEFVKLYNQTFNTKYVYCGCNILNKKRQLQIKLNTLIKIIK